ncbi:MAG: hypothetical protein LBQ60_05270 [Bacteroidales bacterium]|jgi:hypothetical protein|nr:hypothetical protein [Bacteroidales bacterium]
MKKIISSTLVALLGIISASAQYYIGGSFSFNRSASQPKEGDKTTTSSFSISPEMGYRLSDKIELGMAIFTNFSTAYNTIIWIDIYGELKFEDREAKTKEFQVTPYLRYSFIKLGKLNISGTVNFHAGYGVVERIGNDNTKYTHWGTSIHPTIIYHLFDNWTVFSHLKFFNLGFFQTKIKDEKTTTEFNFDLDAYNILPSIGLIYKF